jgi:DNA processing protein
MSNNLLYKIAVSIIPKVGPLLAKRLIAYAGSAEAVFREKKSLLSKVPGIGENIIKGIRPSEIMNRAEKEIDYIEKNSISVYHFLDNNYPERLKHCEDSPVNIYVKGNIGLNSEKVLGVVGTRSATDYGFDCCEKLIDSLTEMNFEVAIVSGLAYGIDICAHLAALKNKQSTIAVLGHGLSICYPSVHERYIKSIMENGCLVTEFLHDEPPERGNFVSRNRIIAGLTDATIVIESGLKGGALITAQLANSYHREVFAFPGRTTDKYSLGCNKLIKYNEAALIENADDLVKSLMWEKQKSFPRQKALFVSLSEKEKTIFNCLAASDEMYIDKICITTGMAVQEVSSYLLNMEFNGLVKSLPGKIYKVIR